MRILVPIANRFIRQKNTDWRYAAITLPLLSRHCPNLDISVQDNWLADAEVNFRYALSMAGGRGVKLAPHSWHYALEQDSPLYFSDIQKHNPDVLLSYERYPRKSFGLPVVWATSPSYTHLLRATGLTEKQVEQLLAWKQSRAHTATKLIFSTKVSLNAFIQQHGESLQEKSVVIPFFFPGLHPLANCMAKWQGEELRFLFVGRQANRKGLPATLAGLVPLLKKHSQLSLTVVSTMDDGPVSVPDLSNIQVLQETNRERVLQLMADSHVLMMPSSWESYGFVYVEAMSQGCLPVALDHPIQRELIDDNGILLSSQEPQEITEALTDILLNRGQYCQKAERGLSIFEQKHSPETIANQVRDVCEAAILQPEIAYQ